MDVFGFREAQETTVGVTLPGGVQASVVSLPALALLAVLAGSLPKRTKERRGRSATHHCELSASRNEPPLG
jgi:hypothetical protein